MATASNTTLATSESIKTYVDASSGGSYGNVEVQDYLESLTSVIIGKDASTLVPSESHVIIGDGARVINSGVGIGENAYCYKEGVAIGRESLSGWNGHRAIAIGELAGSKNLGFDSVALGYKAGGGDWRAVHYPQIRNHTTHIGGETGSDDPGVGTTALGYQAGKSDSGNYSVAVGFQAGQSNQGTNSIIISSLGSPVNNSDSGSITIKSNAAGGLLEYDPSSNVWTLGASVATNGGVISGLIDPTQPDHAASKSYVDAKPVSGIAVPDVTIQPTAALQSIAIGENADAAAAFAIAIGKNSSAPNNFAIAIGENSAAATYSVALGYNAQASNYATALGWSSKATGPAASALGHECEALGSASIAIGSDSTAITTGSMAIGYKSDVSAPYGLVLGSNQDLASSALYTVAVGTNLNNQTYTHPNAIFIHAGQENSTRVSKIEVREELVEIQAGSSLGINTAATLKWEAANSWTFGSNVTAPGYNLSGAGSGTIASTDSIILDGANGVINQTGTFRLANMDTATRNGFTASNGDMIYNTTDGRIQAYQAGTWINLDDGTAA
jgi:hypothetical protein